MAHHASAIVGFFVALICASLAVAKEESNKEIQMKTSLGVSIMLMGSIGGFMA